MMNTVSEVNQVVEVEIVLIEDDANDIELFLRALEKQRLANKMIILKDGEEATDFLFSKGKYAQREEKTPPRVIFLDIKLPKIDGIEILRQVRLNEGTKKIPVVMFSSSKEERDIRTCYELGANSYVSKPLKFKEFNDVVSELGFYWMVINKVPMT